MEINVTLWFEQLTLWGDSSWFGVPVTVMKVVEYNANKGSSSFG